MTGCTCCDLCNTFEETIVSFCVLRHDFQVSEEFRQMLICLFFSHRTNFVDILEIILDQRDDLSTLSHSQYLRSL